MAFVAALPTALPTALPAGRPRPDSFGQRRADRPALSARLNVRGGTKARTFAAASPGPRLQHAAVSADVRTSGRDVGPSNGSAGSGSGGGDEGHFRGGGGGGGGGGPRGDGLSVIQRSDDDVERELVLQRRNANFRAGFYSLAGLVVRSIVVVRSPLTWYVQLAGASALVAEIAARNIAGGVYLPMSPGAAVLATTAGAALWQTLAIGGTGGRAVARSMGGRLLEPGRVSGQEAALLRLVDEAAAAAALPAPPCYLIPSHELNAFAAGFSPRSAAIGVTRGAIERFTTAELRAVLGHEIAHISNGDSKSSTVLAAVLAGFYGVSRLGINLLTRPTRYNSGYAPRQRRDEDEDSDYDFSRRNRRKRARRLDPFTAVGISLVAAGAITWVAGSVLRNLVSRDREYLADSCGARYSGRPQDLASALERIEAEGKRGYKTRDLPRLASPYSHLYFAASPSTLFEFIFATHPPIRKRIERLRAMHV